jgi:hypothetical protein
LVLQKKEFQQVYLFGVSKEIIELKNPVLKQNINVALAFA